MIFRTLIIMLLIFGMPLSALADLTLGVVPRENSQIETEQQAIRMASALKKQLGERVKVRIFADETTLHTWLNRYQLVDIAVFTRSYVRRQPPGEFLLLHGTESFISQDALVLRQGISQQLARKIQAAVPALASDLALRPLPGKSTPESKTVDSAKTEVKPKTKPRIRPVREKSTIVTTKPLKTATSVKKPETLTSQPVEKVGSAPSSSANDPTKGFEDDQSTDQGYQGAEITTTASDLPAPAEKGEAERETDTTSHYSRANQPTEPTAGSPPEEKSWFSPMGIVVVLAVLTLSFLLWRRRSNSALRQKEQQEELPSNLSKPSIISAALNKIYDNKPQFREMQKPDAGMDFDFTGNEELPTKTTDLSPPVIITEKRSKLFTTSEAEESASGDIWFSGEPRHSTPIDPDEPETSETTGLAQSAEADLYAPEIVEEPKSFDLETTPVEDAVASPAGELTEPRLTSGIYLEVSESTTVDERLFVDPEEEENPFGDDSLLSIDYEEVVSVNEAPLEEPSTAETTQEFITFEEQGGQLSDRPSEWLETVGLSTSSDIAPEIQADEPIDILADNQLSPLETSGAQNFAFEQENVPSTSATEDDAVINLSDRTNDLDVMQLTSDEITAPADMPTSGPFTPQEDLTPQLESRLNLSDSPLSAFDDRDMSPPMEKTKEESISTDRNLDRPSFLETEKSQIIYPEDETTAISPDSQKSKARQTIPLQISGELGPSQLPALLKLIAGQKNAGTLTVRSRLVEKRIYFRKGKIAGASSNNRVKGTGSKFLMSKLGELLIRKGRISEEERDHALKICSLQPSRRIGEVLLETCGLTHDELKNALRLQAEEIIFSLILFPSGNFKYTTTKTPIPAEEDLAIEVNSLLKEASRQADEWRELRKTIPSLNTIMEFKEDCHKKLHNARLTQQQDMILSLVNGKRPIHEICSLTGVLEFEIYKFLYLMIKARIISPINTN